MNQNNDQNNDLNQFINWIKNNYLPHFFDHSPPRHFDLFPPYLRPHPILNFFDPTSSTPPTPPAHFFDPSPRHFFDPPLHFLNLTLTSLIHPHLAYSIPPSDLFNSAILTWVTHSVPVVFQVSVTESQGEF